MVLGGFPSNIPHHNGEEAMLRDDDTSCLLFTVFVIITSQKMEELNLDRKRTVTVVQPDSWYNSILLYTQRF